MFYPGSSSIKTARGPKRMTNSSTCWSQCPCPRRAAPVPARCGPNLRDCWALCRGCSSHERVPLSSAKTCGIMVPLDGTCWVESGSIYFWPRNMLKNVVFHPTVKLSNLEQTKWLVPKGRRGWTLRCWRWSTHQWSHSSRAPRRYSQCAAREIDKPTQRSKRWHLNASESTALQWLCQN